MAVPSTMLPLGTPAPDFTLPDTTGASVSLDRAAGAPALVVCFLCNHCPYVKHIADRLAVVTADLIDRGVAVFGISSNDVAAYPEDGPAEMAVEAAERGYRFPYLYDESQATALAYRAACTPDLYVFDGRRQLVYRGQFDSSRPSSDLPVTGAHLTAAVEAVLAGEPPLADQVPSLGCSIKWRPGNEPAWA
jgi:peroxiredoxin